MKTSYNITRTISIVIRDTVVGKEVQHETVIPLNALLQYLDPSRRLLAAIDDGNEMVDKQEKQILEELKDLPATLAEACAERDERAPKGSWAPGNYYNKCSCGAMFIGDKRAVTCAPCAYGDHKGAKRKK